MSNPLLDDLRENQAFPSVSIALPTLGQWYDEGVLAPDVDPKDVPVGVLGVIAEQNYRDPWLLATGQGMVKLIRSVCPSVLEPAKLAEIDIETILIASRLASYGEQMKLKHSCYNKVVVVDDSEEKEEGGEEKTKVITCNQENEITIDLQQFILRYEPITEEEIMEKFHITLEKYGQEVFLQPMPYHASIELIKQGVYTDRQIKELSNMEVDDFLVSADSIQKYSEIVDVTSEATLDSLVACIHHVKTRSNQAVQDREAIKEWLLVLPTQDVEQISSKVNEYTAEFKEKSTITYTCSSCGQENRVILELDSERLFGQAGVSEAPKKPSPQSGDKGRTRKQQSRISQR